MTAADAAETSTGWGVRDESGDVIATASEFQSREAARRDPDRWTPVRRTITYGLWEDA